MNGGRLAGKVALVSGAARGMGAAEAERFCEEGASVVLGDVLADELAATTDRLAARFADRVLAVHLDVTRAEDWQAAVDAAVARFGGLHVLVNNAGVIGAAYGTTIHDYPLADFEAVLAVNLVGTFLGMQTALGAIVPTIEAARAAGDERATGSIVNISSAQALRVSSGNAAYAASKWGVRGLTKVAALDAAPLVRVNSVHPGPIDTPMVAGSPEGLARAAADVPLGRVGDPVDVANLVLFLASDESAYCTGSEFLIEGGRVAGPPRA
jgi:3alpha(or 20beta)-hydroxysteroid dehydrogenase